MRLAMSQYLSNCGDGDMRVDDAILPALIYVLFFTKRDLFN